MGCEPWKAGSGANACVVVEPEDLTDAPALHPAQEGPVEREAFVHGWLTGDDLVTPELYPLFFGDEKVRREQVPEEVEDSLVWATRLGSAPTWELEESHEGFQFLGQMYSELSFYRAPPEGLELRAWQTRREKMQPRTYALEGPNFGDMEMAYLFCKNREDGGVPEVVFFWQWN